MHSIGSKLFFDIGDLIPLGVDMTEHAPMEDIQDLDKVLDYIRLDCLLENFQSDPIHIKDFFLTIDLINKY